MNFYDVQFQMSEEDKMENDYGYAAKGAAASELSNLDSAMQQMEETITRLADNVDRMNHKLEPVLNDFPVPSEAEPGQKEDRAPYSTVVHTLSEMNERLKSLSNRVNTLTYRLDV